MKQLDSRSSNWLIAGFIIWIITVPLLTGISDSPAKTMGIIVIWLLFPLLYGFMNRDWRSIGFTKENIWKPVQGVIIATIVYSVIRNLLITFVPGSIPYTAASAIQVAELLKQGQFGNITGSFSQLFPLMLFMTFLAAISNELFYRGFLFTRLRHLSDWRLAAVMSALMFGIYHYFNAGISGFIMGVIVSLVSGVLMQKYNNIIAPALFHFLQYILTIMVFYYFVI